MYLIISYRILSILSNTQNFLRHGHEDACTNAFAYPFCPHADVV